MYSYKAHPMRPQRSLSPGELRYLRSELPIGAVIDDLRVASLRAGPRLRFECPACRTFATNVHTRINLARCFRCARNYNPIDLTMAVRGITFLDAVRVLSELARNRGDLPPKNRPLPAGRPLRSSTG